MVGRMSTPSEQFKTGCTGKAQFTTFTKAASTAKRMRKYDGDCHVEAYHCLHCQHFHVGENKSYGRKNPRKDVPPGTEKD